MVMYIMLPALPQNGHRIIRCFSPPTFCIGNRSVMCFQKHLPGHHHLSGHPNFFIITEPTMCIMLQGKKATASPALAWLLPKTRQEALPIMEFCWNLEKRL